jgi:uncharacterized protein YyaL (SSP411 family)
MIEVSSPWVDLELQQKLRAALAAKGAGYRPRTRHIAPDGSPKYTNRLILENSPYLLQHAHNPVDWYPWGEEAFAKAKRENKPIFLSSGYATCHWCHVMEEQSFENEEIAALLNQNFVPVKLDREQRPDVDSLYMHAVQLLTGHGGWPMSVFLTPDGKPFFGGTYFPPEAFKQLLQRIADAWHKRRAEIEDQAERLIRALIQIEAEQGGQVDASLAQQAVQEILDHFDPQHGGFGSAPKFPNEPWLCLLLDELWRNYDQKVQWAVSKTLSSMALGGIYDQVGGGFHRYSVDSAWQIPHFEKMLYNQAQLGRIYVQAYLLTGEEMFARVARQTLDYVLAEMTSPEGGFYCATDADSEGEEGKFFVWTPEEIRAGLPEEEAELAIRLFGITQAGNFEGKNVLHLPKPLEEFARCQGMAVEALLQRLDSIRQKLYAERAKRVPPLRDDKILTAWNGMMIGALAEAGRLLPESRYLAAAKKAAEFLWQRHWQDGQLLRATLDGRPSGVGLQEDYAFLAEGFLALYGAGAGKVWLNRAQTLVDAMLEAFWDEAQGAFFMHHQDGKLPHRPKDIWDGAYPSGNAAAARVLARLWRRAPEPKYEACLKTTFAALAGSIRRHPSGFAYLLLAVREFEQGETGPLQYAAQGTVRIEARRGQDELSVMLSLRSGWQLTNWHLAVAEPARGWQLGEVVSPAVDRDEVTLKAPIVQTGKGPIPLGLTLEACGEGRCFPPEIIRLQLP